MSADRLAIHGGSPVRSTYLPYAQHSTSQEDITAVAKVLASPWLTGGPQVSQFEGAVATVTGARHAVAVASGTAGLHSAVAAAGVGPGDEVVTTPLTFVATVNCVLFQGGTPVLADIDPATLNLDPIAVRAAITARTKAIVAVHYAGLPCDLEALRALADRHGLVLIEDACHALAASYRGQRLGAQSELAVFSFHPVKLVTTGEGGAVVCQDEALASFMRRFRNHGIDVSARDRLALGTWRYEVTHLGYNYRITDLQCALGLRQLERFDTYLKRRREIVAVYMKALREVPEIELPVEPHDRTHAWHLFVVRLRLERLRADRDEIAAALRAENIGVNVHYKPVHLHRYYRQRFGDLQGQYPRAEDAFRRIITLPLFPAMEDSAVADVVNAVQKVIAHYRAH